MKRQGIEMKKLIFLFMALGILIGVFLGWYLFSSPTILIADEEGFVIAQAVKNGSGQWVAKIDNTVITLDKFRREFRVHVYSLPLSEEQKKKYESDEANKKKFLINLINEYLVYNKAIREGYDKKPFVKDLLEAVRRRAIIQVYLNDKIEPRLKEIPEEQIEAIYNQNKKLFAGVDFDVAQQQIRMQLLQRQYNELLNEIIDELKGEAKVIRNDNVKL